MSWLLKVLYYKDEETYFLADDETRRQVKAEHVVAVRNCSRDEVGLQVEGKVDVPKYSI